MLQLNETNNFRFIFNTLYPDWEEKCTRLGVNIDVSKYQDKIDQVFNIIKQIFKEYDEDMHEIYRYRQGKDIDNSIKDLINIDLEVEGLIKKPVHK